MNLLQLAESLPNGLHDAELQRVSVSYEQRTAILDLEIWIAEEHSPRELYRPAQITLTNFEYFVVEPPDPAYPYRKPGTVTIDLSAADTPLVPGSDTASAFRLFVNEWNAFIYGAANEATLEWRGSAATRGA